MIIKGLLYLIISICLLFPLSGFTQKNKKSIEKYKYAFKSYQTGDIENCTRVLNQLISDDSTYTEPYLLLAEVYFNAKDYKGMVPVYEKLVITCGKDYPNAYLLLANCLMYLGETKKAKTNYETFILIKGIKPELKLMAEEQINRCNFSQELISKPVPFNLQNLGKTINSFCDEYYPCLLPDELIIVFTRKVPQYSGADPSSDNTQEDFYISNWYNNDWTKALPIPGNVNTLNNEGAQTISGDGQFMVFAACGRSDGMGQCDLYYSKKVNGKWSVAKNMGNVVNTLNWESQPSLSSDGRTLYFASERPGGHGQSDIWKTTIDENNIWTKPINTGDVINTNNAETSPFIHQDNKTLYFCSNGHLGVGGFDIFFSKLGDDGIWSEPKNLGYPINTVKDEIGLIVNASGNKAYITSSREGGFGLQDLYVFDLYKEARPEAVTYFKGKVFDKETKKVVKADFELKELSSGKTIAKSASDDSDGSFLICLTPGKDYGLFVSSQGYMFYSENFNLTAPSSLLKPFEKNIPLEQIKKGSKTILKNIFFDTDSYRIKSKSGAELNKLISFMNTNPSIKVEISGHTDSKGEPPYNMILSLKRAKAVFDYLIKNGISETRLTYKGFGDTIPVSTNETDEGRSQNRRTEIKIVE